MELKVNQVVIPEKIIFNYEELKQELTTKAKMYASLIYTDAEIKEAKSDRAKLNNLKKALNDERIRQEKEYMQPFNEFKAQINEIIKIVDEPIAVIDSQVKSFEEKQKEEKRAAIEAFWNNCALPFDTLQLDQIFNSKWLNASVNIKNVCKEINAKLEQIEADLSTLANLPDFSFEATETYKHSLNLNEAISEGKRLADMQKLKAQMQAEAEKVVVETLTPPEVEKPEIRTWLAFKAHLTIDDAVALREFFTIRNIEFEAIL